MSPRCGRCGAPINGQSVMHNGWELHPECVPVVKEPTPMTPASEPTPDVVEAAKRIREAWDERAALYLFQFSEDALDTMAQVAYESARGDVKRHSIRESRMDGAYVECSCDSVVRADEWSKHAATPAPTVKPDRETVARIVSEHMSNMLGQQPGGPLAHDYELADALLALWPGRSEREVKVEALREAAEVMEAETTNGVEETMPYDEWTYLTSHDWLHARATALEQGAGE